MTGKGPLSSGEQMGGDPIHVTVDFKQDICRLISGLSNGSSYSYN